MTNRVEDGFDNDESGGSPPPWPHQARVWARPPPPDKVREKIIMLKILLFCRMMKNRDRWLKKFIGNLNSINLLLGSFFTYIDAKQLGQIDMPIIAVGIIHIWFRLKAQDFSGKGPSPFIKTDSLFWSNSQAV